MVAAWAWVAINGGGPSGSTLTAEIQHPPAPHETPPAVSRRGETEQAARGARIDSSPPPARNSRTDSFPVVADYFVFAEGAAPAALAGDPRAQYELGQVLLACEKELAPVASMRSTTAAGSVQAYLALMPRAEDRASVAQRIQRCEKFLDGSPLDGLGAPEDARSSRYWLDRAAASRDPLAVMDRALAESTGQHWDSVPPERRARLLDDVRVAVASREPAALFKIGTLFSSAMVARDTALGAAWRIAACEAGYDCSNGNPEVGQGCSERNVCDPTSNLVQTMQQDLGEARFAEVRAEGRDILARINRGDWDGLEPYLATR